MVKAKDEVRSVPTPGQLRELRGWARRLTSEQYQERRTVLRRVTDPEIEMGPAIFYPFKDQRPLTEDWLETVEREGALCEGRIDVSRLETVPFHLEGDPEWLFGGEMLRRAADEKKFPGCQGWGQHQAEQLLAQASELPEEMRQFVLVFPDTILVSRDDGWVVTILVWRDGMWRLGWHWLAYGFYHHCRLLRLRPQAAA